MTRRSGRKILRQDILPELKSVHTGRCLGLGGALPPPIPWRKSLGLERGQSLCAALRPGAPGTTGAAPSPPLRNPEGRPAPECRPLSRSPSAWPDPLARRSGQLTSECRSSSLRWPAVSSAWDSWKRQEEGQNLPSQPRGSPHSLGERAGDTLAECGWVGL